MPKKSKDHKTHKESSSKEHGNQKASQMKGSEKAGQEKELKNAGRQEKEFKNAGQAKGFENANNNLPDVQGPSIPNGSIGNIEDIAKKGCLPKLSILVLPFVAILVYVLLSA